MEIKEQFAIVLKQLLQKNNISVKLLSNSIGISRKTIMNWLNCKQLITVENVLKIKVFFHCKFDVLLGLKPIE